MSCHTWENLQCRRPMRSKLQVNAAEFVGVQGQIRNSISQPGKSGYISSENLFKPSKWTDALGEILADTRRAVGFEVREDNELFADRVCSPCAHKILYELVLSSIGSGAAAFKTPPKQRIMKRIQAASWNAAGAAVLVASLFVSTMLKLLASLNLQAQLNLPSKP